MKKTLIFISVFILLLPLSSNSIAQAPDTVWTRTFGGNNTDDGYSIDKISDTEFILVGYTASYGNGAEDVWLLKVNNNGDSIWTRTHGTSDEEYGRDVRMANDGDFIITGQKGHFPFSCQVLTIKTDSMGNEQWSGTYGGCFANTIRQTMDYGYVSVGCTPWEWYLLRYNSNGDTLWTSSYSDGYNNYCYDVQEYLPDMEDQIYYLMVGCTGAGSYDFSWDVYFLKVDDTGSVIESKRYGDPRYGPDDWASTIEPTSDSNFIIGASTMTLGAGGYDIWLMKITPDGDTLWTRTYGGGDNDAAMHAIETEDGGYIIVGYTESFGLGGRDVYIVRANSRGDTLWTKTVGGPDDDCGRKIVTTGKGEYIIVGYTESFGAGGRDVYLIKLAPDPVIHIERQDILIPQKFVLYQNYPNPFNATTVIRYELPKQSQITIDIYDLLGRKVETLINEEQVAGYHQITWNANDKSTGIYFYKVRAGEHAETRKMLLLK